MPHDVTFHIVVFRQDIKGWTLGCLKLKVHITGASAFARAEMNSNNGTRLIHLGLRHNVAMK